MTRRKILLGAAATALFWPAALAGLTTPLRAQEQEIFPDDRILGAADAPITLIEYSSLTCPHCAAFHRDSLPQIKENWIATGKIRLVYRHFPLDGMALRAAAVANCIEGERFFSFLDLLFKGQQRWATAKDPLKAIGQMARLAGMSQEKLDACAADEAEMNRIMARRQNGVETYGVESTPTLIINGRKVEGASPLGSLETIFKQILTET